MTTTVPVPGVDLFDQLGVAPTPSGRERRVVPDSTVAPSDSGTLLATVENRLARLQVHASAITGGVRAIRLNLEAPREHSGHFVQEPTGYFDDGSISYSAHLGGSDTYDPIGIGVAVRPSSEKLGTAVPSAAPLPVPDRITKRDYNYFNQLHAALAALDHRG